MNVGSCIVFSSINSVKLVTQNYEKKVTFFSKYVLLKKVAVPTSKKYIFWIISYSGENKLLWNSSFAEKVFIFNKELIKKNPFHYKQCCFDSKFVSCWLVFSNRLKKSALAKIGSMQILTSEKCTVTLKQFSETIIVPNAEIIIQKNGWLQVLLLK